MSQIHGRALIIDNNFHFINEVKNDQKLLEKFPTLFAKTFLEATNYIKQDKYQIRVIFLSSSIGPSHGLEELKQIRTTRPNVPLFLISHEPEREPAELFDPKLGFQGVLKKPSNYGDLVKELETLFSLGAWNDVTAGAEEKFQELTLNDEGYLATSISDFALTAKSFFNLFIKIGTSKFIKILNAGDPIQKELLDTYIQKGMKYLYIPEEEHKKYLIFCDEVSRKVMSRADVGTKKKIINVLNLGANISQSIMLKGINAEKLDLASSFLNQSISLVRTMRTHNKDFKKFLDMLETKEHCSTVAFLSGLIGNETGLESSKAVKIVGLAALVHDIGLYTLDPDFVEENLDMDPAQQEIFEKHPRHGASLLRDLNCFEEVVCQAVDQHHMRRRGNDPLKRTSNINLVTEIIGVSDEIHHLLLREHDDAAWSNFITVQLKDFSPQIEKAVLKILGKEK